MQDIVVITHIKPLFTKYPFPRLNDSNNKKNMFASILQQIIQGQIVLMHEKELL